MLVGGGITVMVAVQVVLNIAVVTNLIPPTGVTLPFISYGGNAMWLFMGAMGIMLNISKSSEMAEIRKGGGLVVPAKRMETLRKKKQKENVLHGEEVRR
jgi:cell division protein FtsW